MRALLALVALALAACGQQPSTAEYTPQHAFGFTESCTAQSGSRELCTCIWGKVEANVPRADFDALERMPAAERTDHPLSRQIEGYAVECAATLPQPTTEPEATP
jgi:hypothetical protein